MIKESCNLIGKKHIPDNNLKVYEIQEENTFLFPRVRLIFILSVATLPPDQPNSPLTSLDRSGCDWACLVTPNQQQQT